MIKIHPIEAFNDNYIWLITTNTGSIVFDPGESSNLLSYLDKNILDLKAIFITCLLYTSPSPRDKRQSRMPSSA